MCKAWHQYNERLQALALLNSPLVKRLIAFMNSGNIILNRQFKQVKAFHIINVTLGHMSRLHIIQSVTGTFDGGYLNKTQ